VWPGDVAVCPWSPPELRERRHLRFHPSLDGAGPLLGFGFHPDDSDRTRRPFRDRISSRGSDAAPGSLRPLVDVRGRAHRGRCPFRDAGVDAPRIGSGFDARLSWGSLPLQHVCWPRVRFRSTPASPPAGFGHPPGGTIPVALPVPDMGGSVPEVSPSEVSPFVDGCPSPGPCPPAVGAVLLHPVSHGVSFTVRRLQGFVPDEGPLGPTRPPDPLVVFSPPGHSIPAPAARYSNLRPPCALSPPLLGLEEGTAGALGSLLSRDPLSSREVAFPPGLSSLVSFFASLEVVRPGIHGLSSAVPPLFSFERSPASLGRRFRPGFGGEGLSAPRSCAFNSTTL